MAKKYIDADKLIVKIQELEEKAKRRPHPTPLKGVECVGELRMCEAILSAIYSLCEEPYAKQDEEK